MGDVRAILSDIVRKDIAPSPGTPLADLDGWDSLKAVKLVLKLEEELGRDLTEADIDGLRAVGDVSRLLGAAA